MNKQQRDTRLNTNGGGETGLTTIHMNKNNTEQELQIKPETGSGIRNSTRNRNLYTEMTRKEKCRTHDDIENVRTLNTLRDKTFYAGILRSEEELNNYERWITHEDNTELTRVTRYADKMTHKP